MNRIARMLSNAGRFLQASSVSATSSEPSIVSRNSIVTALALSMLVGACATRQSAPVEERTVPPPRPLVMSPMPASPPSVPTAESDWRPQSYTVKRGDTLHQIALDHGLDYRELATWNGLDNPNIIRVGQVLRLAPPGEQPGAPATASAST